jgi:hypothetical protein
MKSQEITQPRMLLAIRPVTRSYLAGPGAAIYPQFFTTLLIAEALVRPLRAEDRQPSGSSEIMTGAYGVLRRDTILAARAFSLPGIGQSAGIGMRTLTHTAGVNGDLVRNSVTDVFSAHGHA